MADHNLPYQDPTTINKRLDAETFSGYDSNTVFRERMLLTGANSTTAAELLSADPSSTAYGLVVRDINTSAIAAFLDILDDWDDSDRAKINAIVGQAGVAANQGATDDRTIRVVHAGDAAASTRVNAVDVSFEVKQVSGLAFSVQVNGFDTTVGASIVDSSGVGYSGSNPVPVSGTVAVSGVTASIQATLIDSSGVGYSGSNAVPTKVYDGAGNARAANVDASNNMMVNLGVRLDEANDAVVAVGKTAADSPVTASPVTVGGRGSNANPTGVSTDGDVVDAWLTRLGARVVSGELLDDAAYGVGTSRPVAAGFFADETSTDSVDEGDVGAARMTLDRMQIITPRPSAAGGTSIYRSLDLDESAEDIKTSSGNLYGWFMYNNASSTRYVKFYNEAKDNISIGTATPTLTIPIPASSAANMEYSLGILFSSAISFAATTGVADNDTGAPSANDVVVDIFYK